MKIIISAGGTGGHIYPALAIINKFKEKEDKLDILYIGTHNRMEKDIIPSHGIKYEALEIYGFSKNNMLRNIKNISLISKAKKKCKTLMEDFKPDIVLGVGGYVTYPVVSMAKKLGIKTFIHEQNSLPGKSNKMLENGCDLVAVSFPKTLNSFDKAKKVVYTGNPCGESAIVSQKMDKKKLGLTENKKLILMVAGSLGSETLNNKMKEFLLHSEGKDYEIVYITGKSHYETFIEGIEFSKSIKVLPYLDNLPSLMKSCDLIITRGGASTISEVLALELPAIYIPSPYVANNEQYYNTLEIVEQGAALMIEEKALNAIDLSKKVDELINDDVKYNGMKSKIKKLGVKNSSELIYEHIKDLIK